MYGSVSREAVEVPYLIKRFPLEVEISDESIQYYSRKNR
jgi:hypothetical protein